MVKSATLYDTIVEWSNKPYKVQEVSRLIILIKKGDPAKAANYKYQLFCCMSKCVLKAVNNFFSICKKCGIPDEKIIHEREDIAIECFLRLENCLDNVNLKYLKMFYFYFNSGLNRAMFRLYKQHYEKFGSITVVNTEENEKYVLDRVKTNHHFDLLEIDLAGFTPLELAIIQHKLDNEKLKDFLKQENLPATQYYPMWEAIQAKLFELYKNPETNKLEY